MSFIGKTIIGASTDEANSSNLRTCRQCGNVSVPRAAAAAYHCIHCGSVYDATGVNTARYPNQGQDVVAVGGHGFTYKPV